jgi:hypothetical protein
MKWANFEKIMEFVAELLAYAFMIYFVYFLYSHTREELNSSHFLKIRGGIGGH